MNKYFISFLIIFSRLLDLFTTTLGLKNFDKEEQNLIVKWFNFDIYEFFVFEMLLALILVAIYLYYESNKEIFFIKTKPFCNYIKELLYSNKEGSLKNLLFSFKIKNLLIIIGSILPKYIISTSLLFSLNNFWVYRVNTGNRDALEIYLKFDNFYFFDFLIFVFPFFLFIFLLYDKLKIEYKKQNDN